LFHNATLFGSCIIHVLRTGCAKIKKKKFRRQKVNVWLFFSSELSARAGFAKKNKVTLKNLFCCNREEYNCDGRYNQSEI
jgi:hypothetical protein